MFWTLYNTDVYSAVCWDRLHAYILGLFASHLWEQFKSVVNILSREAAKLIDIQCVCMATINIITVEISGQSRRNPSLEWIKPL